MTNDSGASDGAYGDAGNDVANGGTAADAGSSGGGDAVVGCELVPPVLVPGP